MVRNKLAPSVSVVVLACLIDCAGDPSTAVNSPAPSDAGTDDAAGDAYAADLRESDWSFRDYDCPTQAGAFPPGRDRWSALVTLRNTANAADPSGAWYLPPIHAVLLKTGNVLVVGNLRAASDAGALVAKEAFLITPTDDPQTDREERPLPLSQFKKKAGDSIFCAGHGALSDGRILFIGGDTDENFCVSDGGTQVCDNKTVGLSYAQIFDPDTSTFSLVVPDMLGGKRWYPTATRLPGGSFLAASGQYAADLVNNHSVERFDPSNVTAPWQMLSADTESPKEIELTEDYTHVYALPRAVVADGRPRGALVMGESGDMFLFDHAPDFEGTPQQRWVRRRPRPGSDGTVRASGSTAVMLPVVPNNAGRYNQGAVLVIGGGEEASLLQRADVYDPAIDKWCEAAGLGIPRAQGASVLLPDGNVLILSGHADPPTSALGEPQRTPQIFDPRTGAVYNGTPWPDGIVRGYHNTAVLLPDARVLVMGGRNYTGGESDVTGNYDERPDMRYYSPPYLGPLDDPAVERPRIEALPSGAVMHYGQPFAITYSGGSLDAVSLVALGASTHSFDQAQREIQLDFRDVTGGRGEATIVPPPNSSRATEGYYMLFVMRRVSGWLVPSIAKIIKLE